MYTMLITASIAVLLSQTNSSQMFCRLLIAASIAVLFLQTNSSQKFCRRRNDSSVMYVV